MDTHFFVDVNRAGNRGRSWPRDQDRNRSRPSVCEDRRNLESLAFQLQIPRISIWSCRSVDGVFWCSIFREPANWSPLPADPHRDRLFADVRRGALFVRCRLRGSSRNSVRFAGRASPPLFNRKSAIKNRKLRCGGGEIRTHEAFRPSGFQDRRDQPLCHPS